MALENFGVGESLPEGLTSDGQNLYMTGQAKKALFRINPITAEAKQIGSSRNFGTGEFKPVGLAFHDKDLYMLGQTGKCLYKVSTNTGKATKVGKQNKFGVNEAKPVGLASDGQTLYMTGVSNGALYSLQLEGKEAGTATQIGVFKDTDSDPRGLAYNQKENILVMIGGDEDQLYKVNQQNGQLERIEHPQGFEVEEGKPTGIAYFKDKLHLVGYQQKQIFSINENGIGERVGSEIIRTGGLRTIGALTGNPGSLVPESGQVTVQSGGQSRLLFAEQVNYWTPVSGSFTASPNNRPTSDSDTDRSNNLNYFYKYIPIVTSIGLSNQTSTIPIEFLKGTSSANKQQQGGFSYSGGFGIGASTQGTQLFFKGITNASTSDITSTKSSKNTASFTLNTTISFASLSTPQTIDGLGSAPSDPLIPEQLTITLPAGGDNTVIVEGYDYHNQKIRETLTFSTGNRDKTTKAYFRIPVTVSDADMASGDSAGSIYTKIPLKFTAKEAITGNTTVTSLDESQVVTFRLNDNKAFKGWTVEAQKGGTVCHTYVGVVPVSFTTSLSRDQALTYDFECLAYNMKQYENAEGQDTKAETYDPARPSAGMNIQTGRTGLSQDFKQAAQELFTGWQSQLRVKNPTTGITSTIPLLDATFTVNQTIEQAMVIMGERNPGPYFRSGLREVTLSGNMLLTKERDWITEFEDNTEFEDAQLILVNAVTAGFPYKTVFEFGKGQLTTAPDASVDGLGLISIPFNMAFFQNEGTSPNDFKIIATYHQEDWFDNQEDNTIGGLYASI